MLNKMQMIMIPIFLLVPVLLVHNYSGRIRAVWRKPEIKLSDLRKP